MNKIKKVLIVFTMIVLVSVSNHSFLAATVSQDGLEVTLSTDKAEYHKNEQIIVTLTVKNTNDFSITDLSLENLVPEGYKLAENNDIAKQVESLGAGETVSLTVTYIADSMDNETEDEDKTESDESDNGNNSESDNNQQNGTGNNPETDNNQQNGTGDNSETNSPTQSPLTGDKADVIRWIVILSLGMGILIFVLFKNKKSKNLLSILLCIVVASTVVVVIASEVYMAEETKSISLIETIKVEENEITLKAEISYTFVSEDNSYNPEVPEISLGEDVIPDLDFEPEEAEPTFSSKEEEVANIAGLNGGQVPYTSCDDNNIPNYIDGKFSDKKVNSIEDAVDALNDIHYIMQFENPEQEFEEVYESSVNLGNQTNYYRLQQVYHSIPVYGYQLIVSTDSNGTIQALNGHYYPEIDMEINPRLSMNEAKDVVIDDIGESVELVSDGLYIYVDNQGISSLVWIIRSATYTYIVSAQDGEIISGGELFDGYIEGTGKDTNNNTVTFPVVQKDNKFYLADDVRNIIVHDSALQNSEGEIIIENTNDSALWSTHPEALSAYSSLIKVYDYYANILGRNGTDDAHKQIKLVVRGCVDTEHTQCLNAYCSELPNITKVVIYHNGGLEKAVDILAHEYTHGVCRNEWLGLNGISENARGAINEGYADIIGDLIEEGRVHLLGNFSNYGTFRDAANPNVQSMQDAEERFCLEAGQHKDHNGCDKGNVHDNATLIANIGYRIDQNWPESNHANELATLFYKSMSYLTPNSTFLDCRHAVLAASKSMNMSDEKRNVIATAFSEVGIKYEDEEAWASAHHIIGVVKDAETDSPIIDAKVIAVATEGLGGGIGYTNGTGNYDVKVNRAVYKVSVFAEGYRSYTMENVDLSSWINMDYYMETIYLTPAEWADDTQNVFAAGKVTNALTGEALEGTTIKFRSGAGNQTGAYVQTVAGLDIELITDSSGKYYTAALPAGNYTLEASKDGFVVGYLNIVSGNSEVCNNQNITLTPKLNEGAVRIVLTWGNDPSDLDSHVFGTLTNGEYFHTYYRNKSDYDGDIEVCNLDVDDRDGKGPETITLTPMTEQPYYYFIHEYAGEGSIATSGASVKIYQDDKLLATLNAPTNQGEDVYWNVFAFVNGELKINNTITSEPNVSYASESETATFSLKDTTELTEQLLIIEEK
ncbi:MAG: M4 family metallopeptidase [Lachnospiraceae bacterium]|nr:M4 family metallopeptidase [Lachnospiraceae bacterium]